MSILQVAAEKRSEGWFSFDPKSPTKDPEVPELFTLMAQTQRGKPERAMTQLQFANVGGVMNPVVEHIGDLTNTLGRHMRFHDTVSNLNDLVDTANVKDKVRKVKKWLTHPYGFEREHNENLVANARENGVTLEEHKAKVQKWMDRYVEEHRKIPVWNEPQYDCRAAAIHVGLGEYDYAVMALSAVQRALASPDWPNLALSYYRNDHGEIINFGARFRSLPKWPKKAVPVE